MAFLSALHFPHVIIAIEKIGFCFIGSMACSCWSKNQHCFRNNSYLQKRSDLENEWPLERDRRWPNWIVSNIREIFFLFLFVCFPSRGIESKRYALRMFHVIRNWKEKKICLFKNIWMSSQQILEAIFSARTHSDVNVSILLVIDF